MTKTLTITDIIIETSSNYDLITNNSGMVEFSDGKTYNFHTKASPEGTSKVSLRTDATTIRSQNREKLVRSYLYAVRYSGGQSNVSLPYSDSQAS